MGNPIFYSCNLDAATITASHAADANFPLSNLQTYIAAEKWKSSSLANNQWLKFDFGATIQVDYIINENFTSWGTGIPVPRLQYDLNDDTNFPNPVDVVSDLSAGSGNPRLFTFSSATKRYWRIFFGTTLTDFPNVGNVFLGKFFDPGTPSSLPWKPGVYSYETSEGKSINGLLRTSQIFDGRKVWKLSFKAGNALSDSKKSDWIIFFRTIHGKLRPFYLLDSDGTTLDYVHLDTDADPIEQLLYNINQILDLPMKSQRVS